MKKILLNLLLIVSIFSGCTSKIITKIEYVKEEPYNFQSINLKGAYIDINQDEQICIPKLKELNLIYSETKEFYDNQIKDYKINKNISKSIDKTK